MPRGINAYDAAQLQGRLWTPYADYPRIGLWYDASDLTTIVYGTGVATWLDKGPRASHAIRTAGANTLWTPNGPGNRPALRFPGNTGGAGGGFDVPSIATTGWTAVEAFLIWQNDNDPGGSVDNSGMLCDFGTDGAGTHEPFLNGSVYSGFCSTTRNSFDPTPALTTRHLFRIRSAANDWKYLIDEVVMFSSGTNTVGLSTVPHIGYSSYGSAYMAGYVQEILIFNQALPEAGASRVTGALAWKWGMVDNLASSSPFKNRPPLIGD